MTAEVTPHHLAFTAEDALRGANFKMMPPLGTRSDREALVDALAAGTIDAVATDHAPHAAHEKEGRFEDAAFGVLGLADAARVVHSAADLPARAFFDRMSVAPARIAGIEGQGRWIAPGVPANIVVFDPHTETTAVETFSRSRNSPYLGESRRGVVRYTIYRGRIVHRAAGAAAA